VLHEAIANLMPHYASLCPFPRQSPHRPDTRFNEAGLQNVFIANVIHKKTATAAMLWPFSRMT